MNQPAKENGWAYHWGCSQIHWSGGGIRVTEVFSSANILSHDFHQGLLFLTVSRHEKIKENSPRGWDPLKDRSYKTWRKEYDLEITSTFPDSMSLFCPLASLPQAQLWSWSALQVALLWCSWLSAGQGVARVTFPASPCGLWDQHTKFQKDTTQWKCVIANIDFQFSDFLC